MNDTPKWFHVTMHTYGAWLYGSPRGFRTRHHREHVEGDYKNPPPKDKYKAKYDRSKKLLKQAPVWLTPDWRAIVGAALRERLAMLGADVIAVAVSATHAHVLAKMPNSKAVTREWTGLAKKHAWFESRDRGWTGQMWAKRSKATAIKDYDHQVKAFNYIEKHRQKEGAWAWTYKDPMPERAQLPIPAPPTVNPLPSAKAPSPPFAKGGLEGSFNLMLTLGGREVGLVFPSFVGSAW